MNATNKEKFRWLQLVYTIPRLLGEALNKDLGLSVSPVILIIICVCVYSPTVKASSLSKIPFLHLVPSSPFLNMSYFTSEVETPACQITGEKTM